MDHFKIQVPFVTKAKIEPLPMQKPQEIRDVTDLTRTFGPWQLAIFAVTFYLELVGHAMGDLTLFLMPSNLGHWCQGKDLPKSKGSACYTNVNGSRTKCTSWEYDRTIYSSSLVEKWDLVCDHDWLVSFSMTMTAFGFFIGCLVSGQMGDTLGRRKCMLLLTVPAMLSCIGTHLAQDFGTFLFCRFLAGMSAYGINTCGYVLITEVVNVESRSMVGILVKMGASAGKIYACIMGYTLGEWSYIQLSVTLPVCLMPVLCWYLPESPRWLILHNRLDEATETISRALRFNKEVVKDVADKVAQLAEKTGKHENSLNRREVSLFDLLLNPAIRTKTFALFVVWTTAGFIGFGIGSNVNVFGKNSLAGVLALSSAGLPGELMALIAVRRFGSRCTVLLGLCVISTITLLCSFTETSPTWLQIFLVTLVQSQIAFVYCSLFLLTVEVYPTVLRVAGLGACTTITKVPGMAAPYIKEMRNSLGYSSPFLLFTGMAATASFVVTILPNVQRPELLEILHV